MDNGDTRVTQHALKTYEPAQESRTAVSTTETESVQTDQSILLKLKAGQIRAIAYQRYQLAAVSFHVTHNKEHSF